MNATIKWADKEIDRLIDIYMDGVFQDGYAPGSEPPNELEELDMLTEEMPMIQMTLAQPPTPEWEAVRSQMQQKMQRYIELRLKYPAGEEYATNGQYPA